MIATTDKNTGLDPKMWEAVQTRDSKSDGRFVYGVSSTGIYCRPSCPSRKGNPSNVRLRSRGSNPNFHQRGSAVDEPISSKALIIWPALPSTPR